MTDSGLVDDDHLSEVQKDLVTISQVSGIDLNIVFQIEKNKFAIKQQDRYKKVGKNGEKNEDKQEETEKEKVVEREQQSQHDKEKENETNKIQIERTEAKIESKRQRTRPQNDLQAVKRAKLDRSYNLRRRGSTSRLPYINENVVINVSDDPECFRDRILSKVDLSLYHLHTPMTDVAKSTLDLCRINTRSQLDHFTHNERNFIIKTWLTTVRIFQRDVESETYSEVKRIPHRYIKLAPNLITSVCYCDQNLYIGYLTNKEEYDDSSIRQKDSYLEIRNLRGELQSEPYYYDQVIKSIDSRGDLIYVMTTNDITYIHHKRNFRFRVIRIDFKNFFPERLINISAKIVHSLDLTLWQIAASTTKSVVLSLFTALNHNVWQSFNLDITDEPGYSTESTHFIRDDLIVIGRKILDASKGNRPLAKCRIIIGRLFKSDKSPKKLEYFIQEATICLDYQVSQIECYNDRLYILGFTDNEDCIRRYELGCIFIKDLKPIWAMPLKEVDPNSKILIQNDHIVVVRDCQTDYCINLVGFTSNSPRCGTCNIELPNQNSLRHDSHPGILRDIKILCNKALLTRNSTDIAST